MLVSRPVQLVTIGASKREASLRLSLDAAGLGY
jgi:hypothetical protein